MKYWNYSLVFIISCLICHGQEKDPLQWTISIVRISENKYEVHLTALMDPSWHIYSQRHVGSFGAPTKIYFARNPLVIFNGEPREYKVNRSDELVLNESKDAEFEKKADFVQEVELKNKIETNLQTKVFYMVCNNFKCMPPKTVDLNIHIPK